MANLLRSILAMLLVAALVPLASSSAQEAAPKPPKQTKPKPKHPAAAPAAPTIGGVQPTLLGTYGEWGAYTASPGGKKICFALAKPGKTETVPANRPRDPTYLFVSSRPTEKVKDEVSVIIGYGFKPDSDATIELGGSKYAMYTQGDGAWVKNAAEEPRLVDAMRKGSDLTIKGASSRGTETTDIYSHKGLSQAIEKADQECPPG